MTSEDLRNSVVNGGEALTQGDAADLMEALLQGEFSENEITELLAALHERGETAPELAGFAQAMRSASVHLPLTDAERDEVVDTCGTGGDGSGTFNISTAVGLVAAAAGARVAKHGNRSITSRCGSADVLEALGVPIGHSPEAAAESIRRHGFAFLLATNMHPAMKVVAPARRSLPFRTVFNLLGPMTNPAGARRQVLGVYAAQAVPLVAEALSLGGHMRHALVVHGDGGMDELSLSGESSIAEVQGTSLRTFRIAPESIGIARSQDPLRGGDASENAAILLGIFQGGRTSLVPAARRDIVLLNAAAVLQVAGIAQNLPQGKSIAAEALDSGRVLQLLENLRRS